VNNVWSDYFYALNVMSRRSSPSSSSSTTTTTARTTSTTTTTTPISIDYFMPGKFIYYISYDLSELQLKENKFIVHS
jgi:hypothetical protein